MHSSLSLLVLMAFASSGRVVRVPEHLTVADWRQIRAEYERHRHAAVADSAGFHARNFRQHWLARFDGRGVMVEPDGAAWRWGLVRAGGQGQAQVSASGNQVFYHWPDGLDEWFVNDTRGLEHGFTLARPAEVRLAVRGGLQPRQTAAGIEFADTGGTARITYTELAARDAGGRRVAARMRVEGGAVVLRIEDPHARYPVTIDPVAQQAYLKASNPNSNDEFGWAVAVSGDTIVVSAPSEASNATGVNGDQTNNSAVGAGAAYVFTRTGTQWTQQAYLKPSNTGSGFIFGYAVGISGDTIVVGAYGEKSNATGVNGNQADTSAVGSGASYVFVRNGSTWTQQAYLKASNTSAGTHFGTAVTVSGDTVAVGSFDNSLATGVNGDQANALAPGSGAAYVFTRTNSTWSQQAYLKASNTETSDGFGVSVGVSGDTLVVGAPGEDSSATGVNGSQNNNSSSGSGAAYVFQRSGSTWTQQAYLKASNTATLNQFGTAVAISGDTVMVGAPFESSAAIGVNGSQSNSGANQSGAAYVFTRNGALWSQQAYLKPSNTRPSFLFGRTLSVSGDQAAVTAVQENSAAIGINGDQTSTGANNSGAVYLFERVAGVWAQSAYVKASNTEAGDEFGYSVSISGDTMVVGATNEASSAAGVNGNQALNDATDAGAAYVFSPGACPTISIPASTAGVASGDYRAGRTLLIQASGATDLTMDDQYYADVNGVIILAPTYGTGGYTYFFLQSPLGPPVAGGNKIFGNFPFGALIGVWGTSADTSPPLSATPFLVGSSYSGVVPDVAGTGGGRLFLMVNDAYRPDDQGSLTAKPADGTCRSPLLLSLFRVGSFNLKQNAAYEFRLSNPAGSAPTSGVVTVKEQLSAGLSLVSMSGVGWTCAADTCTRSDALPGGSGYPPITITVNVSQTAPPSVTNLVSVTGGGGNPLSIFTNTSIVPGFSDSTPADFFFDAVNLMREYSITAGCGVNPPLYCPNDNVTRAQMAIFVVRTVMGGDTFTYSATPHFNDVPADNFAFKWVQKMYELGITAGCGNSNYCPNENVTRGQMAIFVIRARLGTAADATFPYPPSPLFTDVPANHPYFKWIQRMKTDLITAGCGNGSTYCPNDPVTRGQMAIFLMRGGYNLLLPAGTPYVFSAARAAYPDELNTIVSLPAGQSTSVSLTGQNTNFAQGVTQVDAGPGVTVGTISVLNPYTLTVTLTPAANAALGPRTLVVTGNEQAILPNGVVVQ